MLPFNSKSKQNWLLLEIAKMKQKVTRILFSEMGELVVQVRAEGEGGGMDIL